MKETCKMTYSVAREGGLIILQAWLGKHTSSYMIDLFWSGGKSSPETKQRVNEGKNPQAH